MLFQKALEKFDLQERGMEFEEYYNEYIGTPRKRKVRELRKKGILESL